jgi:hypothetical protein
VLRSPEFDYLQRITYMVIQLSNRVHALADQFAPVLLTFGKLVKKSAGNAARDDIAYGHDAPSRRTFGRKEDVLQEVNGKNHYYNSRSEQSGAASPERVEFDDALLHPLILALKNIAESLKGKALLYFCFAPVSVQLRCSSSLR